MRRLKLTNSFIFTLSLSVTILLLSLFGGATEPLLEFNRTDIIQGQYWRLLTCNLVHYGNAHLAMNIAALLLVGFSLLRNLPLKIYIPLLFLSGIAVGMGTLLWNPELLFYRGLSGVLHGLIVAGLLLNSFGNRWINFLFVGLVFTKIIHEHQNNFQENQLQALIPVMVAVDSHLYGASAGLLFMAFFLAFLVLKKST